MILSRLKLNEKKLNIEGKLFWCNFVRIFPNEIISVSLLEMVKKSKYKH